MLFCVKLLLDLHVLDGALQVADGVGVGLALDEAPLLEGRDAGNVAVVDLQNHIATTQAALVGIAVLADEAYHRAAPVGHDGHLEWLVADHCLVALVVRLEQHAFPEGVDDERAVVEQLGADVRAAFLRNGMHIAEGEVGPLQTVEGQEIDGIGMFHSMHADGALPDSLSLHLCGHMTALIDMLLETLAVHGIEVLESGVEQHMVHVAHKGADPHVGYETAELVLHLVALLLGKELLLVGKDKTLVLGVYLTAKPFVDEVEADDAVIASRDGTGREDGAEIAVDGEVTQTEGRQLYDAQGVGMVVDVEGDDVAHFAEAPSHPPPKGGRAKHGTLRGSRVEHETVLLALYLNGQEDAVVLELDIDSIGEAPLYLLTIERWTFRVLIADGEAQRVAVHVLGPCGAK